MKKGAYWHFEADGLVVCDLCPHACRLTEGRKGICRARACVDGELVAEGYGLISSANVDPIEKKPLYHFLPGSGIFSIGGWGCNFGCVFCQNWTISQSGVHPGREYTPREIVDSACDAGVVSVAYTYNEPLVNIEFVSDCARLARERGLKNVLVTNGYINPGPGADILQLIDALNVDIKSMEEGFYRKQCKGTLKPVLDFCVQAVRAGRHLEITNLLIPGLNDGEEQVRELALWIAENLGTGVPLHLSGYYPQYKMELPATPSQALERSRAICASVLDHVYVGNVRTSKGQDTVCRACGATLIERAGYRTRVVGIDGGACRKCGAVAPVVM